MEDDPCASPKMATPPKVVIGFWNAKYDQEFLYIHVEVTDATPMMNDRSGAGLWQADGLEVFIGHEDLAETDAACHAGRLLMEELRRGVLGAL